MLISAKEHIKQTIKLAIPVSIGQLGHVMLGVIDSLMVGRLGDVPLAASSIANGFFFLILVIGIGLSFAITSLVSIAVGADKSDESSFIFKHAFYVNFFFSIIFFIASYFSSGLFVYMGQPAEVAEAASSYLRIVSFSIFPFMLFQTFRQFSEGLSFVNPPMVIVIITNFINFILNWIFIYGNLGFPAMGLDGAAVATLTSRIFMGITMCFFVLKSARFSSYKINLTPGNFDFSLIRKIIRIGIPSGFQYFFEVAAFTLSAIMVGWLGSKFLAAHQIALNMASVSYMIILGIAAAGNIRVGNAVGKKNIKEVREAGFIAVIMATTIMLCSAVIFIIFRNELPKLYISDPAVIEISSSLLIVAGFFQIFDGIQAVSSGILRGIVDVKIPMYIILISYWAIAIPAGYILAFHYQLAATGIWYGFLIGLVLVASLLLIRFNYKSKHQVIH